HGRIAGLAARGLLDGTALPRVHSPRQRDSSSIRYEAVSGADFDRFEQVAVRDQSALTKRAQYPGQVDFAGRRSVANAARDVLEGSALQLVDPGLAIDDIDARAMDAGVARQVDTHEDFAVRPAVAGIDAIAGCQADRHGDAGRVIREGGIVPPHRQAVDGAKRHGAGDRLAREKYGLHCFASLRAFGNNLGTIGPIVIGTIRYGAPRIRAAGGSSTALAERGNFRARNLA